MLYSEVAKVGFGPTERNKNLGTRAAKAGRRKENQTMASLGRALDRMPVERAKKPAPRHAALATAKVVSRTQTRPQARPAGERTLTADDSGIHPRVPAWLIEDSPLANTFPPMPAPVLSPSDHAGTVTTLRPRISEPSVSSWVVAQATLAGRARVASAWSGSLSVTLNETLRIVRTADAVEEALASLRGLFESMLWSDGACIGPSLLGAVADTVTEVQRWVGLVTAELEEFIAIAESNDEPWGVAGRSFTEESALHVLSHVEPRLHSLERMAASCQDGSLLVAGIEGAARVRDAIGLVHDELRAQA